jgi:hypothetical protein
LRQLGQIGDPLPKFVPALDAPAYQAEALEDLLRVLTVVPEIGTRGLGF